jgi:hypothetical protein
MSSAASVEPREVIRYHARFRRAVLTKNLKLIDASSRELQHVGLDDALRVLVVCAATRTATAMVTPIALAWAPAPVEQGERRRMRSGRRQPLGLRTFAAKTALESRRPRWSGA